MRTKNLDGPREPPSWCSAAVRKNGRAGAGEVPWRTDDERVFHDLKTEPAAREV